MAVKGPELLTPHQRNIVTLVVTGMQYKLVAHKLGVTFPAIQTGLRMAIYPKLGVTTRAELIRYWIANVEMKELGFCAECRKLIGGSLVTKDQ